MAAILKRAVELQSSIAARARRCYSLKMRRQPQVPYVEKKFQRHEDSLAAKGFLRPIKAYEPPADVKEALRGIFERNGVSASRDARLDDAATRFAVLRECHERFKHGVPNSALCHVETVGDVVDFYLEPVDTVNPLDAMKRKELPKNLHIQYEYHRFHPDTDTMFRGVTAFPQSSTLVTGVKERKKYKGHIIERDWTR